jgi:hypothetical protein
MIQNSIKLDFGSKKLEFFFGMSFLGVFLEEKKTDVKEIYEAIINNPYAYVPDLMFRSHVHNCKRKKEDCNLELYEMADLIEGSGYFKDDSESSKFLEVFLQSIIDGLPKPKTETKKSNSKKK